MGKRPCATGRKQHRPKSRWNYLLSDRGTANGISRRCNLGARTKPHGKFARDADDQCRYSRFDLLFQDRSQHIAYRTIRRDHSNRGCMAIAVSLSL